MTSLRCVRPEILDDPDTPRDLALQAYDQLALVERLLGVTGELMRALHSHRPRPYRVIDIGCGNGHLLRLVRDKLEVSVAGVDLRRLTNRVSAPYVYVRDATAEPIPKCDVALCVFVAHHLTNQQLENLIGGVGARADRLIIVDLVRNRVPDLLFRTVLAPWLLPVVASDGKTSIENSFTVEEFASIAARTRRAGAAKVIHRVAFARRYQVLDIRYRIRTDPDTGTSG